MLRLRNPLPVVVPVMVGSLVAGCVPHRVYNERPDQYLQALPVEGAEAGAATADLAVIEFDDHGILWDRAQLDAAIERIRERNRSAQRGTIVVVSVHGWQHDANPATKGGALERFRRRIVANAAAQAERGGVVGDHVVGVFIGWRGDTSDVPLHEQLTFWDRLDTAERVASVQMRETVFRIMNATKEHPGSRCILVGHSMGGMIVGRTIAPTLTTLLLSAGAGGARFPVDLVLLQNPALDALSSWQVLDFLKRTGARVELRSEGGEVVAADGPIVASITSEADWAIGLAYPFGRTLGDLFTAYRTDHERGRPSQRDLARTAEGRLDALVSHRAWLDDDGEIVLERVPGAWNDTPYWIIRVTADISSSHGDVGNAVYGRLVERLLELNSVYRTDLSTWIVTESDGRSPSATTGE